MKKSQAIFLVITIMAFTLSACAKPPVEEMSAAQDAVTRAENNAGAVTYAGNTLIRARDALARMQEEANAKRYDEAKNFAAEATALAERAIAEGQAGITRARNEAALLLNNLSSPLAETANALNAARQAGDLDLDYDTLSGEMDQARDNYSEAQQSLAANDFNNATTKVQDVRSLLSDINASLSEAALASSRKK